MKESMRMGSLITKEGVILRCSKKLMGAISGLGLKIGKISAL